MWNLLIEKVRQIDALILLLVCLIILFITGLIVVEKFFIQDTQIFQVMSGLLTGFAGALLGLLKPHVPTAAESKKEEIKDEQPNTTA